MKRLKVSANKRYLVTEDGGQFFWMGDTAWELLHSLSREEMKIYLDCRAKQGFNVVQTVALAECDGLREPNFYGRRPIVECSGDFSEMEPDEGGAYSYWDHVDYFIAEAEKHDMYVALLPTWGDKYHLAHGIGPVVFNSENAEQYGQWIGERYKNADNIIWILGGDRFFETEEHFAVIAAMARGIKKSGATQLISLHPGGGIGSSKSHPFTEWLDFHMNQSGHMRVNEANYEMIQKDYSLAAVKPTLDVEPRYEDHPINFSASNGYFDAFDVRQAAYWSVFSGGCGITYGHHSVWRMVRETSEYFIMDWQAALHRPAAEQMHYLKELLLADDILSMRPSQECLAKQYAGANYIAVLESDKRIYCYTPCGMEVRLNDSVMPQCAFWMDPKTGVKMEAEKFGAGFIPPSVGRGYDWVLVINK